jgi:hypothetical protein
MTDSELLAAQHRVIMNYAKCSCRLEWKHSSEQPLCPKCQIIAAYSMHIATTHRIISHG